VISSLVLVGAIFQDSRLHEFVFVSDKPAKSVSVAGTFNNWDKTAHFMKAGQDGRTWSTKIELKFGKHQYKFVRDGEEWMVDPKAAKNVDDGNGNTNSELSILPSEYSTPALPNDKKVTLSAIQHVQDVSGLNYDLGELHVTLRTRRNDVGSVRVQLTNKQEYAAKKVRTDDLYDYYRALIPWNRKSSFDYRFQLVDGGQSFYWFANNEQKQGFQVRAESFKPFEAPRWVEGTVFYQIFPDRFANGKRENDPRDVMPWDGIPTYSNRFGGDAVGVEGKLPYLKSLGVNAVYFNPIFKSPSNHRYEADSYELVDPQFGTNEEFYKLTSAMHKVGIRAVLDFAFNHTSPGFDQFMDLRTRGEKSPYRDWYFIKSFPIVVGDKPNYEAWYGFPSMPKLNTLNPATEKHLLNVCDFWMNNAKIDGMRLDVANEVDVKFWRKMRTHVKAKNPNLWIVGEIWGDGNPWLKGDQFDSVMNYQFRNAVMNFVAKGTWSATQFADDLMRVKESYPPQISRNMMNLIGSHDTPRFLNECGLDADLALMGAALQFTWVGAPSIYYGDELGMEGGADPMNRKGMAWSRANNQNRFLSVYRKLTNLRRTSKALSTSNVEFQNLDDSRRVGVYSRTSDLDAVVVAFNRSEQNQEISVSFPKSVQKHASRGLFDIISGSRYSVSNRPTTIILKPKTALVLSSRQESNSSPTLESSYQLTGDRGDSAQSRANLNNRSPLAK